MPVVVVAAASIAIVASLAAGESHVVAATAYVVFVAYTDVAAAFVTSLAAAAVNSFSQGVFSLTSSRHIILTR